MGFDLTPDAVADLCAIAKRAGKAILAIYETDFEVAAKADSSPVTEADEAAEALILEALPKIDNAHPIVSEEAFAGGHEPDVAGTPFWLVDPLDGTKEFIKRNGEFTVNIALIEDGAPTFGVVHTPVTDATYWGSAHGAFMTIGGEDPRPIACRRAPADGLTALVSRSHRTPEIDTYLADFAIKDETSAGSSLKFCLVGAGQADLYPRLGRTMEWDTAAGHAVVRFAGGRVTTLDGADLIYGKPGFENPHFVVRGA
jgi:3'(2'), 5'-bisphosphate nucleotidase